MGAKAMLAAMAVATVLVLVGFRREPADPAPEPAAIPERPWLTREAAAQIIGPGGSLGPLFDDVMLGAPVTPDARARIAAFARANDVTIDLETDRESGDLAAIRFAVTYGGCCGSEGAGVLALRLARPTRSECCGCQQFWIDDWTLAVDDRVFARVSVRVNRLTVRWEKPATLAEVVARAAELVGTEVAGVRRAVGDRWVDLGQRRYRIEVPYAFDDLYERRAPRGLDVRVERGKIVEVAFDVRDIERHRSVLRSRKAQIAVDADRVTLRARGS